MAHDVFISYSRRDRLAAEAVLAGLEQRGIRCWIDYRDGQVGRDYAARIIEAIAEARVVVLVFSASANSSQHVMNEVERAFNKGIPIVPLRIEDVVPSGSMEYFISRTHWLDAVTPPLRRHIEQLARSVSAILEAAPAHTGAEPVSEGPVALSLSPPRSAGFLGVRLGSAYELTLSNASDERLILELAVEDGGEHHCSFALPSHVAVPPLDTVTVTLHARPRRRRWSGAPEVLWFTVTARVPDEGWRPTAAGRFEDVPHRWVPYGGGIALVGAAALASMTLLVSGEGNGPGVLPAPTPTIVATVTPTPGPDATPAPAEPRPPVMDEATAFALIDRAVAAKDLSTQGQAEALGALVAAGRGFENADLSGIRLAQAHLAEGTFSGAQLNGSDLSRVNAAEADFSDARLRFANLNEADLSGANLERASFTFADAESVTLANARAAGASFFGAQLRGADLSNADLSYADFTLADLTGARLDGANLEHAFFYATLLDDVSFDGALFANTEFTLTQPERVLTEAHASQTCSTQPARVEPQGLDGRPFTVFRLSLIERIPSSRFSGGIEYSPLMDHMDPYFLVLPETTGPPCASRGDRSSAIWVARDGTEYVDLEPAWGFDTELLSKATGERSG